MKNRLTPDSIVLELNGRLLLNSTFLELNTGEVVGLMGCNGTGKSSLMRVLFGELCTSGSVCLNGARYLNGRRNNADMRLLP